MASFCRKFNTSGNILTWKGEQVDNNANTKNGKQLSRAYKNVQTCTFTWSDKPIKQQSPKRTQNKMQQCSAENTILSNGVRESYNRK